MKIDSQTVRCGIVILAIAAPILYAAWLHYQRNNFTCESHLTIVEGDSTVDSLMSFSFQHGSGVYDSTGEYSPPGQPTVTISNKINFKYWYEEGRVILVSDETNALPKKDEPFRHYIPDFFYYRDRGISLGIVQVNASGYLFSFGNSPAFYCSKS